MLDEHMIAALAVGLRRRGLEAATVASLGRAGASDDEHVEWACDHAWIIVTHDQDYLRIANAGVRHAGIVYCNSATFGIGRVIEELVVRTGSGEAWADRVIYL